MQHELVHTFTSYVTYHNDAELQVTKIIMVAMQLNKCCELIKLYSV